MKIPSLCRIRISAVFSATLLLHLATPSAFAANRYWSADGTNANGSGTWNTSSLNWGSAAAGPYTLAWVNGIDVAVLGAAAASNLTLGENITCGGIFAQNNSASSGNINEGVGPYTLTLGVTGNNVFTAAQGANAGRRLTINTVIEGASGANVVLAGPSTSSTATMALNRANTFVGSTSFSGNSSGAVNLTLGNQLALQNSTLTLSAACNALIFNSTVAANAFTFGGLAGSGANFALQNNAGSPAAIALSVGNNDANTTYAAVLSGAGSLVKIGTGTLTLSGSNTYSGTTTVSDGKLQGVVGGACVNSKVIIDDALATLAISITDNTKTWTCKELAPTAAGTIEFNYGAVLPSTTVSPLTINVSPGLTGLADFTAATPKVKVNVDTGLPTGTYPLMTWDIVSGTVPATPDLILSSVLPGTVANLEVSDNTLKLKITSTILSVVKANNTTNLDEGLSWVGGTAPDSTKMAKWDGTVESANTTNLGADLTWAGISIVNPNGPVTIDPGNTLTLAAAPSNIDMSAATTNLNLNCALALGADNTWNVATSRTLNVGGQVSGAFGITKFGAGTVILSSSANSYTGDFIVSAGTLQLGANNVIPNGAATGNVSVDGTLDLNGKSDTVNGLSGNGFIDNTLTATSPVLTAGANDQSSTFSGILKNTAGTLNLTKTGTGTLTLGGASTLSGVVTISGGTLAVGNIASLANASGITIGAGTTLLPDVTNAVIAAPLTLGAATTISTITAPNVAGSGTIAVPFNLEGAISGAGDLVFKGVQSNNAYGTINLKAASNYTGSTLLTCTDELAAPTTLGNQNIFVRLFVDNALPVTTVVTLDGGDGAPLASAPGRYCELNLGGKNQTIAGLTNVTGRNLRVQRVVNSSATTVTFTVNNADNHTYTGQLGWVSGFGSTSYDNFNLTKSGAGTQTFSGPLRYDGHTTVNGGTLSLGSANPNNDFANVTIASSGAFLNLTFAGTDDVDKLFIGSTQQADGVYGAEDSGAQFEIPQITGSGTLTVATGPVGFALWITGTFANGAIPPADQGADADFDKDGIRNLVEYAVAGQDPTVPNASAGSFTLNTLSYTKRAGTSGLTYAIQESTDLGVTDTWAEVTGVPPTYVNDGTTISYTLTPGAPVKNFIRLHVISD